jgi:hypothetical protein
MNANEEDTASRWKAEQRYAQQMSEFGAGEEWKQNYERERYIRNVAAGIKASPEELNIAIQEYKEHLVKLTDISANKEKMR